MMLWVSQYVSGKIEMAPDLLPHRLLCLFTHCRIETVEDSPISVFAATDSEGVSYKVKACIWILVLPFIVFAVDNTGLLWMKL